MQSDAKKGLLFVVGLVGGAILILLLVIFFLAKSGILEGLSHL